MVVDLSTASRRVLHITPVKECDSHLGIDLSKEKDFQKKETGKESKQGETAEDEKKEDEQEEVKAEAAGKKRDEVKK